jgi:hypothetical protein
MGTGIVWSLDRQCVRVVWDGTPTPIRTAYAPCAPGSSGSSQCSWDPRYIGVCELATVSGRREESDCCVCDADAWIRSTGLPSYFQYYSGMPTLAGVNNFNDYVRCALCMCVCCVVHAYTHSHTRAARSSVRSPSKPTTPTAPTRRCSRAR